MIRVMAFISNGVEYGLHCLLWLVGRNPEPASSRDLADLQGVSASFVAKLFPKLEKVGIVTASEGLRGGYLLARPPDQISVLDVVDAIEGKKSLFDCQEIRGRCALFDGKPPVWSTAGVCGIHAVMLRAERAMRVELARTSLADLVRAVGRKTPANVGAEVQNWLSDRVVHRRSSRQDAERERQSFPRSGQQTLPPSKGSS